MTEFNPRALPTGVGSMPHIDTAAAMRVMFESFPTIPVLAPTPQARLSRKYVRAV